MLILIGPSASGKTEVARLLAKKYQLKKVITYTTRKKRNNEINKIDYNFITLEEFSSLNEQDFFAETTYYNANFYGTAKKDISDNRCIILDPNGFKKFSSLKDERIISFFLSCSEDVRFKRMVSRNDKLEDINKRLINDKIAFSDNNIQGVTFVVDSDTLSIEQLTDKIYNMYTNMLSSLR